MEPVPRAPPVNETDAVPPCTLTSPQTSITLEQGKTFADAMGDVHRGLQVVESACSLSGMMGQIVEVAEGMDTYVRKAPLGVFGELLILSSTPLL